MLKLLSTAFSTNKLTTVSARWHVQIFRCSVACLRESTSCNCCSPSSSMNGHLNHEETGHHRHGNHPLLPNAPSRSKSRGHIGYLDGCCCGQNHRGCCCKMNGCPAPGCSMSVPRPWKPARCWMSRDHRLKGGLRRSTTTAFVVQSSAVAAVDLSSFLRHYGQHRPPPSLCAQ